MVRYIAYIGNERWGTGIFEINIIDGYEFSMHYTLIPSDIRKAYYDIQWNDSYDRMTIETRNVKETLEEAQKDLIWIIFEE